MKTYILVALLVVSASCADFKIDFSNVDTDVAIQTFEPANLNSLLPSKAVTRGNIQAAITNARKINVTPVRSIDSIFSRLPSTKELDQIILSADSLAILKTIQILVSNDALPCNQIVSYLHEVSGRIRSAVQKKQFAADQLKAIIDATRVEIIRLEGELERLEDRRNDLWVEEMREQIREFITSLETLYKQFNQVEGQIAPNEARVAGFQKEIQILQKANDDERSRINSDNFRLFEAQARVRDLQNQLNVARETEAALGTSLTRSQTLIDENRAKITEARDSIDELEGTIRGLRNQADAIRVKITELEIRVERVRTEISVAQSKDGRLDDQIAELKRKISAEQRKVVDGDLDSLLDMIATLTRILPTVQMEIDRQYYFCFGDGAVTTETSGGVLVYIVRGEAFATYIQNAYGQSVNVVPGGVRAADYMFYPSDIFSAAWTSAFGYPFSLSDFNTGDNSFANDFNCLNPSSLQSSQGVISGISSHGMSVRASSGRTETLNLGACTRIESATRVPRVGQNVIFKGVPSSAGGYNVYAASCW